jgi:hypothetical protein
MKGENTTPLWEWEILWVWRAKWWWWQSSPYAFNADKKDQIVDIGADGVTIVRSEVDELVGVGVEIWGKGVEGEGDVVGRAAKFIKWVEEMRRVHLSVKIGGNGGRQASGGRESWRDFVVFFSLVGSQRKMASCCILWEKKHCCWPAFSSCIKYRKIWKQFFQRCFRLK